MQISDACPGSEITEDATENRRVLDYVSEGEFAT